MVNTQDTYTHHVTQETKNRALRTAAITTGIYIIFLVVISFMLQGQHPIEWWKFFGIFIPGVILLTPAFKAYYMMRNQIELHINEDGLTYQIGKQRTLIDWNAVTGIDTKDSRNGHQKIGIRLSSKVVFDGKNLFELLTTLVHVGLNTDFIDLKPFVESIEDYYSRGDMVGTALGKDLARFVPHLFPKVAKRN